MGNYRVMLIPVEGKMFKYMGKNYSKWYTHGIKHFTGIKIGYSVRPYTVWDIVEFVDGTLENQATIYSFDGVINTDSFHVSGRNEGEWLNIY